MIKKETHRDFEKSLREKRFLSVNRPTEAVGEFQQEEKRLDKDFSWFYYRATYQNTVP